MDESHQVESLGFLQEKASQQLEHKIEFLLTRGLQVVVDDHVLGTL